MNISKITVGENRRRVDPEKVSELRESIGEIGLLNPITITEAGHLVAGMHRLEAIRSLGWTDIPCHVVALDGLRAELAEIDENLIRNELHFTDRGDVYMRRKSIYEELYPETRKGNTTERAEVKRHDVVLQPSFASDTAAKTGVSPRTVEREIQLARDLTPAAKKAVRTVDMPKTDALRLARLEFDEQDAVATKLMAGEAASLADAQREVKREEIITRLESIEQREVKAAQGLYDVIVIDPPWPMKKIECDVSPNQSEFDYPTMSEEELAALEIPATADCHVWLWTTHKFLPMALRLLDVWGLKYVCTFVWHKPGGFQPFGLPQYNCEFALYARKGTPAFIDTQEFPVCFDARRVGHSVKPEVFYDMVRRVTAGRRIDMFNRREIDGFDLWGKEAAVV